MAQSLKLRIQFKEIRCSQSHCSKDKFDSDSVLPWVNESGGPPFLISAQKSKLLAVVIGRNKEMCFAQSERPYSSLFSELLPGG